MSVRILSVVFDTPIEPWELPALRGAIARKAGYEHDHFHNHDGQGDKMHYRLPLIQYKQERGYPMLLCLNEGIEEAHYFFAQPDWTLELNGRAAPVRIRSLNVKQATLYAGAAQRRYHIRHWLGLNEDNYAAYRRLDNLSERVGLLQSILQSQVVTLLRQLDHQTAEPIRVLIQQIRDERRVSFKEIKMQAFSLEFTCNVNLPDYIGLGKGCSVGWGVVKGLKKVDES